MGATTRLVRRGAVYYFRMAVPKHLVERVGRKEIGISLRTDRRCAAKVKSNLLSLVFDAYFEKLVRMPHETTKEIDQRVRTYFRECLERGNEIASLYPQDPCFDVPSEIEALKQIIAGLKVDLGSQRFSPRIQADARSLFPTPGGQDDKLPPEDFQYACQVIMRAEIEQQRILLAKLAGDYSQTLPEDPLFVGITTPALPPLPGEENNEPSTDITFGEAVELYLSQAKSQDAPKTVQAKEDALKLAAELFGVDKLLRNYAVSDKKHLRDTLAKLPPNYKKLSDFQGKAASDVASMNDAGKRLSAKTQAKKLDFPSTFLTWAVNEEHIENVPGPGIKLHKSSGGKGREPYSLEQLKAIFSSPIFTGCKSATRRKLPGDCIIKDGYYWIPLVALYIGMRLGEIVQLQLGDVIQIDGIWVIDVNKEDGDGKQIKTDSSIRVVPIHRRLIELGLIEHHSKQKHGTRLFSDIKFGSDGTPSHNFSKWWGRYAKAVGFHRNKTTFHSFRHNFIDATRAAGVSETVSEKLVGHASKTVHSQYGAGFPVSTLKQEIDKVSFCVDGMLPT